MKIDIVKIAEYSKEKINKEYNKNYEVLKDGILSRVKHLIMNYEDENYDIDFDFYNEVKPVLDEIRNLLKDKEITLQEDGYSKEEFDDKTIEKINELVANYFIVQIQHIENIFNK